MAAPGDVRKLTHLFETLSASSPDTTSKPFTSESGEHLVPPAPDIREERPSVLCNECSKEGDSQLNSEQTVVYTPVGYSFMSGEQLVAPTNIREEIPISVPCHECSKEHPRYSDCPYKPCTVCYQSDHPSVFCPYFRDVPQGAVFDHLRYELFCSCGNLFNEDKWVCTFCPRRSPVLNCKQCVICNSSLEHSSWECPKDEVLAAEYREIREYMLSGAYSGVPIPPRGCGQMNEGKLTGSTK